MLHSCTLYHSLHRWDHGSFWPIILCMFSNMRSLFLCAAFFFVGLLSSLLLTLCLILASSIFLFKLSLTSACQWSHSYPHAAPSNPLRQFISARGDYSPQAKSSSTAPLSSPGTVKNKSVDGKYFCFTTLQQYNLFLNSDIAALNKTKEIFFYYLFCLDAITPGKQKTLIGVLLSLAGLYHPPIYTFYNHKDPGFAALSTASESSSPLPVPWGPEVPFSFYFSSAPRSPAFSQG